MTFPGTNLALLHLITPVYWMNLQPPSHNILTPRLLARLLPLDLAGPGVLADAGGWAMHSSPLGTQW